MKSFYRILLVVLLLLVCPVAVSAAKEEVVYANLTSGGEVQSVYVVNISDGGDITDYGDYSAVRILNTTDAIRLSGDTVTCHSEAEKIYYEGTLDNAELPWRIKLTYTLDGHDCGAQELAGQSGKLAVHISIARNPAADGGFFDEYALQATFTLDTELCSDIEAPDATVANVGGDKQLTYTVLPGRGLETTITAQVRDFEMAAVTINGIRLNLNVDLDGEVLTAQVGELIDATVALDDGMIELYRGTAELQTKTDGLQNGAGTLDDKLTLLTAGVQKLQSGIVKSQEAINKLNSSSGELLANSAEMRMALLALQNTLNSFSLSMDGLQQLSDASNRTLAGLDKLYEGALALQDKASYEQYRSTLARGGADPDALQGANAQASAAIQEQIERLKQAQNLPDADGEALRQQIEQLQNVVNLLEANSGVLTGTKTYFDGLAAGGEELAAAIDALRTQYRAFNLSVDELAAAVQDSLPKLNALTETVGLLAEKYGQLDGGWQEYTGYVAALAQSYGDVVAGVDELAAAGQELVQGSATLHDATRQLYDGVGSLCDGARKAADGTGTLRKETAGMDREVSDKIDEMLAGLAGDGDVVSFVSDKNTEVSSVQFVFKTAAVEIPATEAEPAEPAKELTFWQKLLRLFGLS